MDGIASVTATVAAMMGLPAIEHAAPQNGALFEGARLARA